MEGIHASGFTVAKRSANKQHIIIHIDSHAKAVAAHSIGAGRKLLSLLKDPALPLKNPDGPGMVIGLVNIHPPRSNSNEIACNCHIPPEVVPLQLSARLQHHVRSQQLLRTLGQFKNPNSASIDVNTIIAPRSYYDSGPINGYCVAKAASCQRACRLKAAPGHPLPWHTVQSGIGREPPVDIGDTTNGSTTSIEWPTDHRDIARHRHSGAMGEA